MDLNDGLFLGPGEMVHLRLHNRDAAGWYSLGLAGIELVSHADVEIYAALAEKERQMISRRTKDALAAARARGVILGGMREKSLELQAEAEARAEELRSVFVELVGLSHRAAARTLNERGVKTATGKPWSPVTVTRVRQRLDLI
jgi:recombinase